MSDDVKQKPDLTIVGGQPHRGRRRKRRGKIKVPVGLEKVLFHAARDEVFKAELLSDRMVAIAVIGVKLRSSERAMIEAVSDVELKAMIDRLEPANPRRRKFMGLVAAAATSLAAGTAVVAGCDDDNKPEDDGYDWVDTDNPDDNLDGGAGPDVDTDIDTDTDVDTDTDTDMDAAPDGGDTDTVDAAVEDSGGSWGNTAIDDVDGEF